MVMRMDSENVESILKFKNEATEDLKLHLEPYGQQFDILPGKEVEVHATYKKGTSSLSFTLHTGLGYVVVFPSAGVPVGILDCIVTDCDGVELVDSNRYT
jgi:hypothetical protein